MSTETPAKPHAAPKTAVVMIHGMGEQWPMDTLRGFVDATWTTDATLVRPGPNQPYFKPDTITGSFELRRVTTRPWSGTGGRRVDYFEFYWAHMMRDTGIGDVVGWLMRLLLRAPSRVPRRLLGGWLAGLLVCAVAVILAILTQLEPKQRPVDWPWFVWTLIAAGGALFSALWLRPVAGDAARYLSPTPGNVAARQEIREAGIDLLTKLHQTGDYDRIVVAGHSLGSVIGYDVLNYAWGRIDHDALLAGHPNGGAAMAALDVLEEKASELVMTGSRDALAVWRDAQRAYFAELSRLTGGDGKPLWLVSDFVTMGSPLSKADVLLARDEGDLKRRKGRREAPTCPPWLEGKRPPRFSYPPKNPNRTPHHAAVFGPTVWTNIYYPNILGAIGDFISGPVAPQLGPGIRDVRVPIGLPTFRHLSYWAKPERLQPAILALRRALNLRLVDERALWQDQADVNPVRAETLERPERDALPGPEEADE